MNVSSEGQSSVVSPWQLEFARLIAFPADSPFFVDQNWWNELGWGQPEDFAAIRKKHFREDKGSFRGVTITLTVDLGRVVWVVQPSGDVDEAGSVPTLGPFLEKMNWCVELLRPWLAGQCPPLLRLALTGKMIQPAATRQDVYRTLRSYLHLPTELFEPNPPNDFSMQINRRRNSTVVPGLEINRVSTWSKQNVDVPLGPRAGTPFQWPDVCHSAVELDMNTAPERSELLPHDALPRLLEELKALGVEIAECGDIR
jgi:hypothetical protein